MLSFNFAPSEPKSWLRLCLSKTLILDTRSFVKRIFVRLNIILCHLQKFRISDNLISNTLNNLGMAMSRIWVGYTHTRPN